MNNNNDTALANIAELKRRGITEQVMTDFGIEYSESIPYPLGAGVVIPVRHPDGTHSFNKYRRCYLNEDIKQKYAYDKGSHTSLFGVDALREVPKGSDVVITEGEMDALVLWSMNIPAVSSTGGAQSFQADFAELLEGYNTYICYDNDEAGAVGVVKTLDHLPEAKVVFIPELSGVKDISDYVASGKRDFRSLMEVARTYTDLDTVRAERRQRLASWLPVRFHDEYIKMKTKFVNRERSTAPAYEGDDRRLRAKEVDCTTLLEFNRQRKAKCLWHNDSDPSLHYYPKSNSCYCHTCGKYADAIEIVMAKEKVDFKKAMAILLNE